MLIQILDNNQQPNFPLEQYKVIFDTWAEEAGMDKLVWLHTSQVDLCVLPPKVTTQYRSN